MSFLEWDRRVLGLAADPGVPLLERVKLCSIVSSNLDEFFAVRVAELLGDAESAVITRSPDGSTPARTLAAVRAGVAALHSDQEALWFEGLRPALAGEGIRIVGVEDCTARELRSLTKRFRHEIEPLLTPIAVGPAAPFPLIPSLALNIGVLVPGLDGRSSRFVRVNVPHDVPRFVEVGRSGARVAIEDAIVHFLPTIVAGDTTQHSVFRITRDADVAISRDADDLLEAVETQLLRRRFGDVVRLEVGSDAPPLLVEWLMHQLRLGIEHVEWKRAPIGLSGLRELCDLDRPDLKDAAWEPTTRTPFLNRKTTDLLTQIRRRDVIVHHPYDSFDLSVGAFAKAARDPKVRAFKATVYRNDDVSPTLSSLIETAEEGKQALCLVELKARFDERRNIDWSRRLERAGVDLVFGVPSLKVHAKLALLVRQERGALRRYVHIGTGNYHSSNASNYEDFGLFTADDDIAADVADVFNAVTGLARPAPFRKLLVGPWYLRDGILREIERTKRAAEKGEPARIRIKVNSLVDEQMIEALYGASEAGVEIQIVTRGICCLCPGVPRQSERITVRSVLGRFLEHSRIFSFTAGDSVAVWIGSSDLMTRNLDRRIEVLAPIEDSRLRAEVGAVFEALLADTRFSWELGADGAWHRTHAAPGEPEVSAQELLMQRATRRAKKAGSRRR